MVIIYFSHHRHIIVTSSLHAGILEDDDG